MWTPTPMLATLRSTVRPEDVPPATPVELPSPVRLPKQSAESGQLSSFLQTIHRPNDLEPRHLAALGLHVTADASIEQIIPDPDLVPDFAAWETYTSEEAMAKNEASKRPLCVTNRSPGCQTYLDRLKEFSYPNAVAFRTVRRLPHPKGVSLPKLGGSYDFWRSLEALTAFWDDPTDPPKTPSTGAGTLTASTATATTITTPTSPKDPSGGPKTSSPCSPGQSSGSKMPVPLAEEDGGLWRSSNGEGMPLACLQNMAGSFVKLVAYEFGCSVAPARLEPRLSIVSSPNETSSTRRCSAIPSSCTFVYRSATTRVAARAGIVDGPLAAVSVRNTLSFQTEFDSTVDLAREIVAALLTAQHRARGGKIERRFGEGEWWTTKPRWGGGPGGPIGREVDKYDVAGDKDDSPLVASGGEGDETQAQAPPPPPLPSSVPGPPSRRSIPRTRKTMTIYDNYRSMRPPASSWDSKTRYEAIGKANGADHDDVYVISTLVHHISIVRFRVTDRLLDVLAGGVDHGIDDWRGLKVWRSPWYDLFVASDRIAALRVLWAVMGYLMRQVEVEKDDKDDKDDKKDVDMANT